MSAALAALVGALAAAPSRPAQEAASLPEAVAAIDGRPIELERFARFVLDENERSGAGAEALEQLLQERLTEAEARRRGIRVSEAELDERAAQIDRGLREQSQGRLGLEDHLASLRLDRAEFRALLRKSIACERMMAADFGLPAGAPLPAEKQSLWFEELKARARVRTEGLAAGAAAQWDEGVISGAEWALKLFRSLPAAEADRLFEDFVGVELLLAEGQAQGLEVTAQRVAREVEERSRLLREKLAAEGLPNDGIDYLGTLKARGDDPDRVTNGDRFRAEILLKDLARRRHGQDGFRRFYDQRKADFDRAFGRRARVSTIFLKASQQKSAGVLRTWTEASAELESLRRRIESDGAPLSEGFSSQARLRSEHESAARGGDLGFLSAAGLEKLGLPASLLDEKPGSLVGPIVTADGVHLLHAGESRSAAPFEEIAAEVEKAARRQLLQDLRKEHKVERRI
jgi:parvulin-like peptidyl-prolyl isomerase